MKKHIISVILTLCMALSFVPTTAFADTPISDFTYGVSTDGQVTILKYNGTAADVTIPDKIDGKPVRAIGSHAFQACRNLVSVTIPSSVQTIGPNAFENCTSLTSITIPGSVTSLGQSAFQACTSLTSITIPGSVTSIEEGAFIGCTSLASITIQSGVQTIERNAFENCTSLTSVTIPSGVQTIGQNAFYACTSLASVTIPGSVVAIPNGAFQNCTSLTSITIPDSVTSIGQLAFYACTSLASITIPDSVTSIGISAFRECTSLAGITIPDGVTSIGQFAFFECTSLADITIPGSVTSIGEGAFIGCTSLASITVDADNSDYLSVDGVVFSKDHVLTQYPMGNTATSYSIPDGVTSIGTWAFQDCTSLAGITIPSGVETIEMGAFWGCTSLTSVAIPGSVVSIADSAFESCTSLESIFLPDKDSLSIHEYAIPSTVTQVKYSLDETAGEVTITGIALGTDKTGVAIPATICGYPVVAVSDASILSKISSHTCAGGQATCQAKAACGICNQEYGEKDSSNHTGSKVWTTTKTQHKQYWECCNAVVVEEGHTWSNGVCSKCDYICTHKDTDADHVCDYGCSVAIGAHTDADNDHACDYGCSVAIGAHEDTNNDHACDYGCAEAIGEHEDTNNDHACDYGCSVAIGAHEDVNNDHACDYGCSVAIGAHEDTDNDHACDYGCAVSIGAHEDTDNDHACDYGCAVAIGAHEDTDNDHACDYGCSVAIGAHEDTDNDHACDYGCAVTIGAHEDTNNDHACDYGCAVSIGAHEDTDKDHLCNVCGAALSQHSGGEATCGGKAICEYCGKEYGEVDSSNHNLEKISAKDATVTETGNIEYWHCLDCGKYFADKNGTNEIELNDTVTQKLPPEIIEGKGQSVTAGEKKELTFRSNAAFSDFIRAQLDGKTLEEKNYTVKEGSTVVTLKADYVGTLSAGEHTIGIVSASGTATTTFTVHAKPAVPPTGDNSMMWLWIALLFVSGGLLTVTAVYRKRKTQSEN